MPSPIAVAFTTSSETRHAEVNAEFDAVVVGARFTGMYMLHRLRGMGLRVRVFETDDEVGGTWH
jgi:cyclohexanone monooxygenase